MKTHLSVFVGGLALACTFGLGSREVYAEGSTAHGITNVILVHGAWADGSSWSKVIPLLEAKGLHVVAVQNPLTSLADDVAATKRAIDLVDGPVLLVGHSYGGVVITEAGNDPKVAGLVYVAAFTPDTGESLGNMGKSFPVPPGAAEIRPDRTGFLTLTLKGVTEDFAQDLSMENRKVLFAVQGETAGAAFGAKVETPAWKSKPSWYVVAKNDRMISPAFEADMAKRIGAHTTTVESSHVAMLSHPSEVAVVIEQAAFQAQRK
jgi:pimeloyl-ACP methyl ester carboxylesterase